MTRADEYRRNADECQRMADNTSNDHDRRAWLRLAESWMRMVRKEAGADGDQAHDAFDAEHHAGGTRQRHWRSTH
jgi:hypothetical protein